MRKSMFYLADARGGGKTGASGTPSQSKVTGDGARRGPDKDGPRRGPKKVPVEPS
jgi:hypothetical protein